MTWLDAGGWDRVHALDFEDDDRIGPVCWCGGCAEDPCLMQDHEGKAYTFGAAVAFGLMGMAEAIRSRVVPWAIVVESQTESASPRHSEGTDGG